MSPKLEDIFHECKYRGATENCSNILTPILTDEGVCYNFNMLDRDHIFKQ